MGFGVQRSEMNSTHVQNDFDAHLHTSFVHVPPAGVTMNLGAGR